MTDARNPPGTVQGGPFSPCRDTSIADVTIIIGLAQGCPLSPCRNRLPVPFERRAEKDADEKKIEKTLQLVQKACIVYPLHSLPHRSQGQKGGKTFKERQKKASTDPNTQLTD